MFVLAVSDCLRNRQCALTLAQRKRATTAREVYRSVRACVQLLYRLHTSASAAASPPCWLLAAIIPRRSLSFSTPPSLLHFHLLHHHHHHHPPSSPHSLRRPLRKVVTHRSFPPLPPSLRLCLLLRGPRTCTCCRRRLVQGELPSISSQHRPAKGLPGQQRSLPLQPIHTLATHKHTHTLTRHTRVLLTKTYLDPHHHPRTTLQAASGQVSVCCTIRITHNPRQHFPLAASHQASAQLDIAHVIRLARAQTAPAAPLRQDPLSALHTPESSIPASDTTTST